METKTKRGRWVAAGLVVALVLAWGGFSSVEAAPSSITTCTKTSNNKTKVIAASGVAKCTNKGKGVAKAWAPASQFTGLQGEVAAFCAEFIAMVNDFSTNDQPTYLAMAYYAVTLQPSVGAVQNDLCLDMESEAKITTCTKTSNNKAKIIATSGVAKCTKKGKGVAQTWVGAAGLASLQTEASTFCATWPVELDFFDDNSPATFAAITSYRSTHPSLVAKETTLCT